MTLFDTHAHYDDEAFDADRDAVLAAFDGLVIDPGCTLASSQAAVDPYGDSHALRATSACRFCGKQWSSRYAVQ